MEQPDAADEIVDSWKEISRYLNRDVRTLQRWERTRGLPVHRMPGGAKPGVYAVKSELDGWRRGRLRGASEADASPAPRSVAVLPFLNLTSDREDQYFADGLADEIITALSRLPSLQVTARTSSFALRGQEKDIREVGRRLNAGAVIEGAVQRSGNRVRISIQLIDTSHGYHLWSERFHREFTDVFALQDEITRAIVGALCGRLTHAAAPLRRPTQNSEAYRLWAKGRYHTLRQSPGEILRSRSLFEQAIALDPCFARAHVGLAECLWEAALYGFVPPRHAVSAGRQSVLGALELDDTLADAHAMLGVYLGLHDFDWKAAEHSFRRALELSPGSPDVRHRYARYLLAPNLRLDEACAELESALDLDPLSAVLHAALGHCLMLKRDFSRAIDELTVATECDPAYAIGRLFLAGALFFQGRLDIADEILERLLKEIGANPIFIGAAAISRALTGDAPGARVLLDQLLDSSRTCYVPPITVAWAYMGLGDTEAALDWLDTAVLERDPPICELAPNPFYDSLRQHPRFESLLRRMHIGE